MVEENSKINNEYYLDNIFNFDPLRTEVSVKQVDNYKSFGTPKKSYKIEVEIFILVSMKKKNIPLLVSSGLKLLTNQKDTIFL